MKNRTFFSVTALVILLLFNACSSDSDNDNKRTSVVVLNSVNTFVYYSFEHQKNIEVENQNSSKNLEWDIAFWGLSGKTNGGKSGIGNAAVIRTNTSDFENIISAEPFINSKSWEQDIELETETVVDGNLSIVKKNLNPLLQNKGWFSLKKEPLQVTIIDEVFIIRTADSKYVKVQFLDSEKPGTVTFRWEFIEKLGENPIEVGVHNLPKVTVTDSGEVIVSGNESLSVLLKNFANQKIDKLIIKDKNISQADCSFIVEKLKEVTTLDLAGAKLDITDSHYGFKSSKNIKNIILPESLRAVGFGHLAYSNIETITFIGDKLQRIGAGAFAYSNKIKQLSLPKNLQILEKEAFAVMRGLEDIVLPEKVTIIPDRCFYFDDQLKSVTFKGKIRQLGNEVFAYCKQLTKIKFTQKEPPVYNDGEWPFMDGSYFVNEDGSPRIFFHIPKGTKKAYMKAWKFTEEGDDVFFVEY